MVSLLSTVASVTGLSTHDIYWNMPARLVYAYEHLHMVREGIPHERAHFDHDDLASVFNSV